MNFIDADLVTIDAGGNDFAILAALNFGAMAPSLVMVSCDMRLPGQDADRTAAILGGMRNNGYRAAVFGFAADAGNPLTRLTGVTVDRLAGLPPALKILFFRAVDGDFVPSLLGWLEDIVEVGRP
jgi:hypothetical protein